MNKMDVSYSSVFNPSNWCYDAENAPCSDCNSSAAVQGVCLPRKVHAEQDEEDLNKLLMAEASCSVLGEAITTSYSHTKNFLDFSP